MNKDNNIQKNEIIETSVDTAETKNSFVKTVFEKIRKINGKKIKNQLLLKKGAYSFALTALVLAFLILFNWLMLSLTDRFNLEFDMTPEKINSISKESIDYLKTVDNDVYITVLANEDTYASDIKTIYYYSGLILDHAPDSDYFTQTINLINEYDDYNDKIHIEYLDPTVDENEFDALIKKYATERTQINLCDIVVTSTVDGLEKIKVLTLNDIYNGQFDNYTYSEYGYIAFYVESNKIESSLTSAINYVAEANTKSVALIKGHSSKDYSSAYVELLEQNNYDVTIIEDSVLSEIDSNFDAIAIMAPDRDFGSSEIDLITDYLENDGKLGKGLLYFASANCPVLPNLYSLLEQWGIKIEDGVVFETDKNYYLGSHTTHLLAPVEYEDDDLTEKFANINILTDLNVPMYTCKTSDSKITSKELLITSGQTVIAPYGAAESWGDYTDADKKEFAGAIQAIKEDYDSENNHLTSYIMAFSNVVFANQGFQSNYGINMFDIPLYITDRAAHRVAEREMVFTPKTITSDNFVSKVTGNKAKSVRTIFVIIVPLAVVAFGIFVYVRRRNAR